MLRSGAYKLFQIWTGISSSTLWSHRQRMRGQTVNDSGDRRFWAAVFVTVVILGLYAMVIAGVAPVPVDDLKETLKMSVVAVISYWIGSSSGSASKDVVKAPATKE